MRRTDGRLAHGSHRRHTASVLAFTQTASTTSCCTACTCATTSSGSRSSSACRRFRDRFDAAACFHGCFVAGRWVHRGSCEIEA